MFCSELNIILSCLTLKGQEVLGWCQEDVLSPQPALTRTKSLTRPSLIAGVASVAITDRNGQLTRTNGNGFPYNKCCFECRVAIEDLWIKS